MDLSRRAIDTLLALVSASAGTGIQRVRGQDGRDYVVPDVVLHSDQGIYRAGGVQQPFRRGPLSYMLVRRMRVAPDALRLVLVDERLRCSSTTLAQLRAHDLLVQAADGHGYALTVAGLAVAARARCTCAHPLEDHGPAGCSGPADAAGALAHCPCTYLPLPVPVHAPAEAP